MGLLVLAVALSQLELLAGEVPPEIPTFVITFSNGMVEHGALRIGGEWMTEQSPPETPMTSVEIIFDTPWRPKAPHRGMINKLDLRYEAPALRRKRLEEGWKAAGYVFLDTPNGKQPVLESEVELAKRARDMEAGIVAQWKGGELAGGEAAPAGKTAPSGPNLIRTWFGHFVVALLGLALSFWIIKRLLLEE